MYYTDAGPGTSWDHTDARLQLDYNDAGSGTFWDHTDAGLKWNYTDVGPGTFRDHADAGSYWCVITVGLHWCGTWDFLGITLMQDYADAGHETFWITLMRDYNGITWMRDLRLSRITGNELADEAAEGGRSLISSGLETFILFS